MKILLSNCRLAQRTGSELYTWEMTNALQKRGHEVSVYSPVCGELAEKMREDGLSVFESLSDVNIEPEVLHCQHHMTAMAMLARYRDVHAVYQCHGGAPWEEWPPVHPRILRYAGSTQMFRDSFESIMGINPSRFTQVPLCIEFDRYEPRENRTEEISRALVLSNYLKEGAEMEAMREVCAIHGIELDAIGWRFGNVTDNTPEVLPEYDLVFAVGRSALEAMACGCAVIPLHGGLIDEPVGLGNFTDFAEYNFSVRPGERAPIGKAAVERSLEKVPPVTDREELRFRVAKSHDASNAIQALEDIYDDLQNSPVEDSLNEETYFAAYLERVGGRILQADAEFRRLREGWERTKEKYEALKRRNKT